MEDHIISQTTRERTGEALHSSHSPGQSFQSNLPKQNHDSGRKQNQERTGMLQEKQILHGSEVDIQPIQ